MQVTSIDQILLQLNLEVASKVNHDLLGSMHVVNFCSEEMSSLDISQNVSRLDDYSSKLRHSTQQMSETIRLSRLVVNSIRAMLAQGEERSLPLNDSLLFSYGLSQILNRHLPPLNLKIKTGKRMRNLVLPIEQSLALAFIFDWIASQQIETETHDSNIVFEEKDDGLILFSASAGLLRIESAAIDLIQSHHPLFKYLECLGKQTFIERIAKDRDIIGRLKSVDGKDLFFLHMDLFQREFKATLT